MQFSTTYRSCCCPWERGALKRMDSRPTLIRFDIDRFIVVVLAIKILWWVLLLELTLRSPREKNECILGRAVRVSHRSVACFRYMQANRQHMKSSKLWLLRDYIKRLIIICYYICIYSSIYFYLSAYASYSYLATFGLSSNISISMFVWCSLRSGNYRSLWHNLDLQWCVDKGLTGEAVYRTMDWDGRRLHSGRITWSCVLKRYEPEP
jgi:hypothetical protein